MIHRAEPWWTAWRWRIAVTTVALAVLLMLPRYANPFPIDGDQAVLPAGSELNEDAVYVPHEILRSEYHGDRTFNVVALGDLAFNSPSILGDVARRAGISCGTCHVAGASNAKLFVPGMSTRPGTFDTSGPLFNPKADNPCSIRCASRACGRALLAPYGHDGRMRRCASCAASSSANSRTEPSPALLDAIVAYVQEIDFLPNPRLGARGRLNNTASDAERRGEALFSKPFPHDPNLSCAGCHQPAGAFVDHQQHDVGSGGIFKTATLLNANFNAPYFHDGRYDSDQVVDHFDRVYELGHRRRTVATSSPICARSATRASLSTATA
jgi:cytochrome c peroxidase